MTDVAVYQPPTAEIALRQIDDWAPILGQVVELASQIANSPFVPDGLRGSVPATAAAILTARELGVPPMTGLANIHVIKGKTGLSALLMRALIQSQGHDWEDVEVTDSRVIVRGKRRGEAEWTEASFTRDQARQARIDLGGYPQDKLYARATSRLARRKFADVIAGMPYSAEELEDEPGADDMEAFLNHSAPHHPKPRTARRRQAATETASPATPAPRAPEPQPSPPAERVAGEAPMPPLPGEEEPVTEHAGDGTVPASAARGMGTPADERDYDTPATVTALQLKAIWTALNRNFGFGSDEKDQARAVCAHIVSHPLASSKDLTKNEAKTVLDTLASWQDVAEKHEESPRAFLIELMATASGEGDDVD